MHPIEPQGHLVLNEPVFGTVAKISVQNAQWCAAVGPNLNVAPSPLFSTLDQALSWIDQHKPKLPSVPIDTPNAQLLVVPTDVGAYRLGAVVVISSSMHAEWFGPVRHYQERNTNEAHTLKWVLYAPMSPEKTRTTLLGGIHYDPTCNQWGVSFCGVGGRRRRVDDEASAIQGLLQAFGIDSANELASIQNAAAEATTLTTLRKNWKPRYQISEFCMGWLGQISLYRTGSRVGLITPSKQRVVLTIPGAVVADRRSAYRAEKRILEREQLPVASLYTTPLDQVLAQIDQNPHMPPLPVEEIDYFPTGSVGVRVDSRTALFSTFSPLRVCSDDTIALTHNIGTQAVLPIKRWVVYEHHATRSGVVAAMGPVGNGANLKWRVFSAGKLYPLRKTLELALNDLKTIVLSRPLFINASAHQKLQVLAMIQDWMRTPDRFLQAAERARDLLCRFA